MRSRIQPRAVAVACLLALPLLLPISIARPPSTHAAQTAATPVTDRGTPTTSTGGFFEPNPDAATPVSDGPGRAVPLLAADHVSPGDPHPPYNSSPPTSGPHWPVWAEWGVYDEPLPDELQVHNLEHGGVMLQYRCDCPEAIAILERFADPATGYPVLLIAAPYPAMEPDIALTAWGRIQELTAADVTPDAVRAFVDAHVDAGPEQIHTQELTEWRESNAPKP